MKYRKFGELGWNVSALGAMRLPIKGADAAKIKERRVMSNCSGFVAGGKGFEPLSQAPEACALSKLGIGERFVSLSYPPIFRPPGRSTTEAVSQHC